MSEPTFRELIGEERAVGFDQVGISMASPESFNVLIKEMQSLGLDVKVGGKAPSALASGLI